MKRDWRAWHLLLLFALGSVIEWTGSKIRDWAGQRLKKKWFPPDDEDDDDHD